MPAADAAAACRRRHAAMMIISCHCHRHCRPCCRHDLPAAPLLPYAAATAADGAAADEAIRRIRAFAATLPLRRYRVMLLRY